MGKPFSLKKRSSGILLHPTSLPGGHGVGDLGPEAQRFAALLASCGQTWWQMLPVGPIGPGNSPYASPSAFAGSPLLISLEKLAQDGLLAASDLRQGRGLSRERVNYAAAAKFKEARLRKAFASFKPDAAFKAFVEGSHWLADYALYMALKKFHKGASWTSWPAPLRSRVPAALQAARRELAAEIRYHEFVQHVFARQWAELKRACGEAGVGLIGDIPIFVAHDSADVWSRPELFFLNEDGSLSVVAGVPPDYFSKTGQLWGNPLYRWDVLKGEGYGWWLERFRTAFSRFDAVRMDHFIGFQNYWEIPGGAKDAVGGRWMPGPGHDFFRVVKEALGSPEIIAEDLGVVTPEVAHLRDTFEFPGMYIVQFSFSEWDERHQPHSYVPRSVAYTGTHDNDTSVGWFNDPGGPASIRTREQIERERGHALRYTGGDGSEIHWDVTRLAMKSPSALAVIPAQDLLGLGSEARMNTPGTAEGNWEWRLQAGALTPEIMGRLAHLTGAHGRAPARWTP
jgi:4-alpha-glucanotransferase